MDLYAFMHEANKYGRKRIPFLFIIDYELKKPLIYPIDKLNNEHVKYKFTVDNSEEYIVKNKEYHLDKLQYNPINFHTYKEGFDKVIHALKRGDTYLLNLTYPNEILSTFNPLNIYEVAQSKYKLYLKDQLICYSPETFVQIKGNQIYSFPMKGTIDAHIPNAAQKLLNDNKEQYEHNTIVDLIRNDLAMVASHITINNFRYVEKIQTPNGAILQTSSEISGTLPNNWNEQLGDLLLKLLPAGSISGAPKEKTCNIIKQAEIRERGYYTGIFGIFDGQNLDSAVAIRMLQKHDNIWYYHAGGGITAQSNLENEYQELLAKIYVPTFRKY